MKTDGELQARVRRSLPRMMPVFFILNTLVVIAMVLFRAADHCTLPTITSGWLFSRLGALIALGVAWSMLRKGRDFLAFVASGMMIALLLISGGIGMFPNLLISTTNPQYNLTIYNAASASNTLTVMLVIALIGMPIVLLYTVGVYYFFSGKTELDPHSY